METNLLCKSRHFLPLNLILEKGSSVQSNVHILLNQRPVGFSRKKRRRNGSQRLVKFVLESIPIVASKLKVLPLPLDMIFEELSGGNGNGRGRGQGFHRWSDDGWFDGWRRRGARRKLWFWWVPLIFGLGLVLGRETESDLMYWILGFGLISFAFIEIWSRKAVGDGILALGCLGFLAILGSRLELKNRVRDFRGFTLWMKSFRGRRKSRRAL